MKNLKKKQALVKMVFWRPKSSPTELELEGTVEELKKDPRMYQKTAVLRLRSAPNCVNYNDLMLRDSMLRSSVNR